MSGARLQRVLNQAAYEENMRRAAGSALTYGVPEIKGKEGGRENGRGVEGVMHGRSIAPRILAVLGRSTLGFHRPGGHLAGPFICCMP